MNRKVTLTGANIVFLAFSLVFLVYQVVMTIIFGAEFLQEKIYLVVLINEYVVILLPVLFYTWIKKADFRETFRIRKLNPVHAGLIFLISLTAYPVALMLNNVMAYLLQFIGEVPSMPIPKPGNLQELVVSMLVVAVSPAICEELLHRGLLLTAYERRGSIKGIVFTAIFFGIFHFEPTNLLGPIFLGLLIGYYVVRTNSIFAGMLAHFFNNAIAVTLQYVIPDDGTAAENITISLQELGQLVIIGFAGLILTALLLALFRKATAGNAVMIPSMTRLRKDLASILSHWPVIIVILLYLGFMVLYILSIYLMKYFG